MCIGEGVADAYVNASVGPVLVLSTRLLSTIGKPQLSSAARGATFIRPRLFLLFVHQLLSTLHLSLLVCMIAAYVIANSGSVQLALTVEAA